MKQKTLLIFLLCSFVSTIMFAQINQNFYTIKSNHDTYYDSLIQIYGIDSMQGTGYNPYKRWVNHWEPIVYPSGNFSIERQKLEQYVSDFKNNTAPQSLAPFTLNWELIGPDKMPEGSSKYLKGLGQIHYIAFDPNDITNQKMFACSPAGGLWRSLNGGGTWTNAGTDKGLPLCGVSSIAIDSDNSNTHWFVSTGTGEPMPGGTWAQNAVGVGRTTDGGANWKIIGLENVWQMRKIILKRYQGQIHLFVASTNGIYECEDGLSTNPQWEKLVDGNFYDIEFDPQNTGVVYASGTGLNTSIYKIDWINDVYTPLPNISSIPVSSVRRLIIEISDAAPGYLFIVATYYGGLNTSYLYRYNLSTNSIFYKGELPNATIETQGVGPERAMGWTVSPVLNSNNELTMVYGNTAPIRLTKNLLDNNNYCTWSDITSASTYSRYTSCKIHVDMHYMIFEPDGQTIWVGNDGGVFKSTMPDFLNNWEEKNNGLAVATIHHLAVSEDNKDIALSGAYDCGINLYKRNNNLWTANNVVGGDGFQCQFDWSNSERSWVGTNGWFAGRIYRSEDNGDTYNKLHEGFHWHSFFIQNNIYPQILYGTYEDGIKRSIDNGTIWDNYANYPGVNNNKTWRVTNSMTHGNYIYTSWYGNNTTEKQKVFKSVTGGGTNTSDWEDIGSPLEDKWIYSIAVDYFDPDHIWVSAGGKVYSVNTITHQWVDISNGLPSYIEVGNLEIFPVDNGILFAGTNYGLYYYKEQDGIWQYVDGNLPNVSVQDIQIDMKSSRIVVATFGRGVWKADLPCFDDDPMTTLIDNQSGDVTISSNTKFSGNIDIYDNKTLTINNGAVVSMGDGNKITVQPGARLIIDNATITSGCAGYWAGIEVWGDKDEPQTYAYDGTKWMPEFQGEVIIKNGGTIKNSVDGIMAIGKDYNNGEYLWDYTGGIIKATDANFINNNNSIWIGSYHNILPNNVTKPNRSKIIDCHFENDEFMLPGHTGYSFIALLDVDDISIAGNSFINSTENPTINRGRGIVSYGASYNVNALCDVSTTPFTYQNNHFEGLYYGIWTSNDPANTDAIANIDRADFVDVYHGIHLIGTKNAKVTRCNFQISDWDQFINYTPYGIFLKGSDGFTIEGNSFTKTTDLLLLRGIVIENSGNNDNEIYRNNFTDLHVAIQPQYDNRNENNQGGLKLFCNDMNGVFDVLVACGGTKEGIAEAQQISNLGGIPLWLPAGDKFTSCSPSSSHPYNIKNYGGGIIQYLSKQGDEPNCVTYDLTDLTHNVYVSFGGYGGNPECPSKLSSGGDNISTLYSELSSARIALNSSELILNIWENGGDANLEQEVETTQPWDVYVQFNDLLAESPYLSDDVLMATIDNPAFTSLMLKLLMIANPQASHNDEIMQAIYDRIPAMPQSYIDAILAEGDNISQLEILEVNVAADRHLLNTIGNNIKRVYRTDTINTWIEDSLIDFVSRENTLEGKYELASIYLGLEQYDNMSNTLNSISENFELDEDETTDLANWQSFFTIAQDAHESGIKYDVLDETQRNQLESILELNRAGLSEAALSLLLADNPYYDYHEIVLPIPEGSARMAQPTIREDRPENQDLFKVYPNPGHDYITLEYRTGDQYSNLWFTICDVNGREIIKQQLKGGDNEEIVNISILQPDIYTVILYGDAQIIANERITVLK